MLLTPCLSRADGGYEQAIFVEDFLDRWNVESCGIAYSELNTVVPQRRQACRILFEIGGVSDSLKLGGLCRNDKGDFHLIHRDKAGGRANDSPPTMTLPCQNINRSVGRCEAVRTRISTRG